MSDSRWRQDPEVFELIEHFNQPEKKNNWWSLTESEYATILKEMDRCRKDFVYAARNYFWITNKALKDQLLTLNQGQELIYQKMLELKSKGRAQKIVIIKGRQLGALDPDTLVITSDLRWLRIDDLKVGDQLLSVDEQPPGGRGVGRKFRESSVLNKWSVEKEAYRLVFDNGQSVTATADHPFLCKRRGGTEAQWVTVKKQGTRKSRSPIRVGDEVRYIVYPWENGRDYEDGWFGGLLDGEGSLEAKNNGGVVISVSQVAGAVLNRAAAYLKNNNYPYRSEVDNRKKGEGSKLGDKPVHKLVIHRMPEVFRVLGKTRPARFIDRRPWEGKDLPSSGEGESWAKVVSIETVGIRRMVDIETTTHTFIANGFVTHNCSTLIEALIAWRTIFFPNINALVVSYDRKHTSETLYPIMTTVYDRLPWWLKPECASRKADEGIYFATKDPAMRGDNPGLNSRVQVTPANTTTAVGMGTRLSAVHVSEFAAFEERTAKQIIDKEMRHALIDSSDTFAILESTAKGANKYAHVLWKKCEELAEKADWYPLFLPAFFESGRVMVPHPGWRIEKEEYRVRDQILTQWVRCDEKLCLGYHQRIIKTEDRSGDQCPTCNKGVLHPYTLTDGQAYFMHHMRINSARDDEAAKTLLQELCVTALQAFQVEGIQIFGQKAQEFVSSTVRDPEAEGHFDLAGRFHGCDMTKKDYHNSNGKWPCFVESCEADHEYDDNPCSIWEWPTKDGVYTVGGDVAEGLGGNHDYSIGTVLINTYQAADRQVATWRSNTADPITFAYQLNSLGLFYNSALMSVECNKYDVCLGALRFNLNYPNMYRWKHVDSVNINSNKLGWYTDMKSKPRLWQTFKMWLSQEMIIIRSKNACNEMPNFVKDDDDSAGGADKNEHDDEIMAIQIALFTAHEGQWNPIMGMALPEARLSKENSAYTIQCRQCLTEWFQNTVEDKTIDPRSFSPDLDSNGRVRVSAGIRCTKCGARNVEITRNAFSSQMMASDGDIVREIGWNPDDEWDKALQEMDYNLL